MMAQNDLVVAGLDVSKDKVDICIRSPFRRQVLPATADGRRKLITWFRRHKVSKAVMEASGGYERDWAKVLREAGIAVQALIPSGCAASPARPGDWPRTIPSMRR